jgi:hypothetical protein
MRNILSYIAPLLAAGAAAVTIAAPSASASIPACVDLGNSTQCQRPGDVEVNTAPPPISATGPFSAYGPFFSYDRGGR